MLNQHEGQMKLRHWILMGYAIPVVALILSAGITASNVRKVRGFAEEVERAQKVNEFIGAVGIEIQISSRDTRGYLLDPNPLSLTSFQTAIDHYETALADMKDYIRDTDQQQNWESLAQQSQNLTIVNQQLLDIAGQGKTAEAIQLWKADGGRDLAEGVTQTLETMQAKQHEIIIAATESQDAALISLQRLVLGLSGGSVVFSILTGAWIINKTSRQMIDSSAGIASATTEIAATVEQQERTAQQQAASVNETTTTMDELGASSRQSAEQAEAAAAGARQALNMAEAGTRAVDRTLQGMDTLMVKVQAISDQILRLSEQTSQIGNISGLVSDLANQTNMLALNAAVEAVRAGEHGKGFAVVSGEIRKLADQSKGSAEKINALVQDIQNAINSTVMATDEGSKTVEEGVRIAQETSTAFAGVTDAVNNVVLNSQQISLNVKQQSTAIQQVVTAMNSLNTAARENTTGLSQVRQGTQSLNQAALTLKGLV
ncbi:methyl-accepting chemotaxis protein [Prochlorothrix hollandica]|uniref:methyl-accepting chemotaxis protein n=1 Tax=Prochlorothrix hollandica TaxID=1223 RepID=UPI00333EDA21